VPKIWAIDHRGRSISNAERLGGTGKNFSEIGKFQMIKQTTLSSSSQPDRSAAYVNSRNPNWEATKVSRGRLMESLRGEPADGAPKEKRCKSADLEEATWKFRPSGWAAWE
jgi:hypothetical protein